MAPREEGFSLLELTVAIALIALMAAVILDSTRLGIRTWSRVHNTAGENEQAMLVHARVATWLQNAYPANPGRISDETHFPLLGRKDTLSFITPLHPDSRVADLYRVTLVVNDDKKLEIQTRPDFMPTSTPVSTPLLEGVETIEFAYLDENGIWQQEWLISELLPRAVRVRLEFTDATQSWPELVVALRAEDWGPCRHNQGQTRCLSSPYLTNDIQE